jgi:hypothetical protein
MITNMLDDRQEREGDLPCKFHGNAHQYTQHACGCQYCRYYWKACPRCIGSHNANIITQRSDA